MRVSVLISVYKLENAKYLNNSLKSIWTDQTIKPDEIILVEDGPLTDELYDVIVMWKNIIRDRLIIIRNKTNIGLTKSLNKGIEIARYDLIARMDSDDIAHPKRFEKQIKYLESHPNISVVGGSIQEFNSTNECINIRKYPLSNDNILKYIYKASPLAHPAVMIRKSIFDNGIKYNEKYKTSQDIALWFDVISNGYKIANIDDIVLYFRRNDDIYDRRGKAKAKNELKIYIEGIKRVYGVFNWRYIIPITRYLFRLAPRSIKKIGYNSKLRRKLLNN